MSSCEVDGCDRRRIARGWCAGHYSRWKQHGDVQPDRPLADYRPRQPRSMTEDDLDARRIDPGSLSHLY